MVNIAKVNVGFKCLWIRFDESEYHGTEKYQSCQGLDSYSQPLGYKPSALAIELNSSKAVAGKELSLSGWCIASLYIYHFSTVVDV